MPYACMKWNISGASSFSLNRSAAAKPRTFFSSFVSSRQKHKKQRCKNTREKNFEAISNEITSKEIEQRQRFSFYTFLFRLCCTFVVQKCFLFSLAKKEKHKNIHTEKSKKIGVPYMKMEATAPPTGHCFIFIRHNLPFPFALSEKAGQL